MVEPLFPPDGYTFINIWEGVQIGIPLSVFNYSHNST